MEARGNTYRKEAFLYDSAVRIPVGTFLEALLVCVYGYEWSDTERRAYATKRAPHVKAPPTIVVRNALYAFSYTLCGMARGTGVTGGGEGFVDADVDLEGAEYEEEKTKTLASGKDGRRKEPEISPADGVYKPRSLQQDQAHKFDLSWLEFCACLQQDPFFLDMLHGGAALSEANWAPPWSPTVPLATVYEDFVGRGDANHDASDAATFPPVNIFTASATHARRRQMSEESAAKQRNDLLDHLQSMPESWWVVGSRCLAALFCCRRKCETLELTYLSLSLSISLSPLPTPSPMMISLESGEIPWMHHSALKLAMELEDDDMRKWKGGRVAHYMGRHGHPSSGALQTTEEDSRPASARTSRRGGRRVYTGSSGSSSGRASSARRSSGSKRTEYRRRRKSKKVGGSSRSVRSSKS